MNQDTPKSHWNDVYAARAPDALTWYEPTPALSLKLVSAYASPGDAVIDVGGGQSGLVDNLAEQGLGPLTVLDLSEAAMTASKARVGAAAEDITWMTADITKWSPDRPYAIWHDRAAFHFLTDPADRQAYGRTMARALRPGGIAIIATFSDDGPEKCSGLPVRRYAPEQLTDEVQHLLPGLFEPVAALRHVHVTPKGNRQNFQYSVFRKT